MSKKEFVTILAITLIVALVWVISDLVHTRSSSKDLPDVKQYLEPLDPTFNTAILDKISRLSTPAPAPSANPSLLASPSPKTSSSARPTSSASASPKASTSASPR